MSRILFILILLVLIAGAAFGGPKMTIIDVTKFGAVPNDGKSDTAAVLAALEECKKNLPATLKFPKGKYHFAEGENPNNAHVLFPIADFENLTIDGQGSEFIVRGLIGVFWIGNSKNVTAKNLTIDWERPPFSLGKVVAAEGKHFDVEVFPEYPVKGGEPVGAFMDYDPQTRLPRRHGLDEYYTAEKTELVAPQVLRVHLKHDARIKPGVLALLRHQVYGRSAFTCDRAIDITINNVNVYAVPGMGFVGSKCTNITLDKFNVVPRPKSGHLMSATADAVHLSGNKGTITIKNSQFEGMGDDAANIKTGLFLFVRSKVDANTVMAQHNLKMADPPDVGDVIELTDHATMLPFGTAVVKSVEVLQNEGMHKITFQDPLPEQVKEGNLLGNSTRVAKVRVSNCEVRNNRARGFLIQNRDVIVENCKFKNCTSGGVWVLTEVFYFYESIGSRNVVVRNNVFENCNYGGPLGEGVLCAYAVNGPGKFIPGAGVHKNIILEGNRIIGADNCAMVVTSTDGVMVRNNTIEGASSMPTYDFGRSAIYLAHSKNVTIEGNTVLNKKQGELFNSAITYGPGSDMDRIIVRNNQGF